MNNFKNIVKSYKEIVKNKKEVNDDLLGAYLDIVQSSSLKEVLAFYKVHDSIAKELFKYLIVSSKNRGCASHLTEIHDLAVIQRLLEHLPTLCMKLVEEVSYSKQGRIYCEILYYYRNVPLETIFLGHLYRYLVGQCATCIIAEPNLASRGLILNGLMKILNEKLDANQPKFKLQVKHIIFETILNNLTQHIEVLQQSLPYNSSNKVVNRDFNYLNLKCAKPLMTIINSLKQLSDNDFKKHRVNAVIKQCCAIFSINKIIYAKATSKVDKLIFGLSGYTQYSHLCKFALHNGWMLKEKNDMLGNDEVANSHSNSSP